MCLVFILEVGLKYWFARKKREWKKHSAKRSLIHLLEREKEMKPGRGGVMGNRFRGRRSGRISPGSADYLPSIGTLAWVQGIHCWDPRRPLRVSFVTHARLISRHDSRNVIDFTK